jgi:hypothetical protein
MAGPAPGADPHLEEAYQAGEGVLPVLRRRGLLAPAAPGPSA